MLATGANIRALTPGFRRDFERGRREPILWWDRMAEQVPSTTTEEVQGFLAENLRMREWIGPRVLKSLFTHEQRIKNRDFELTVEVAKNDIEDDRLAMYAQRFALMGRAGAKWPDQTLKSIIQSNPVGFDGLPFYSAAHTLDPAGVQSNDFNLPLTDANFDTVRTAMVSYTGENGETLGVMPNELVVPPQLETTAKQILVNDRKANGASNEYQGMATTLMIRDFANEPTRWYLQDTTAGILPWLFQLRKAVQMIMKDGPTDDNVFWDKAVVYGMDSRGEMAPGLWWLQARSTPP